MPEEVEADSAEPASLWRIFSASSEIFLEAISADSEALADSAEAEVGEGSIRVPISESE